MSSRPHSDAGLPRHSVSISQYLTPLDRGADRVSREDTTRSETTIWVAQRHTSQNWQFAQYLGKTPVSGVTIAGERTDIRGLSRVVSGSGASHGAAGWGARIRTWEWRNQNPLPYHLATPQQAAREHSGSGRIALLGRLGRLLEQVTVHEAAVAIEQGVRLRVEREVDDLPDVDGVGAGRDLGHQPAVERHRAALQHRRAGRQARPLAHVVEALVALDPVHAGEALGDLAMAGAQDVDAEE